MSIITAYKSDADGKIFEDKKKYQAHLRKLASQRRQDKKIQEAEQAFEDFNRRMGLVSSIAELEKFIKDNWHTFWVNGVKHNTWHMRGKPAEMHEYVDVEFENIRWLNQMSNSYVCPRNGVTNWGGRNKDSPRGYPGWYGSIRIRVRPPLKTHRGKEYISDGWGSDYFKNTVICTGSGGGGGNKDNEYVSYQYEVSLWADDFPGLKLAREQSISWQHLGGTLSQDQRQLITDVY
jgi:hypothetical protein